MGRRVGRRREKYTLEKYKIPISIPDTEKVTGAEEHESGVEKLPEVKQGP